MKDRNINAYLPLTESTYYILLVLQEEKHGYLIMQEIERITNSRIKMGPGTLYGALSKLEKESIIEMVKEEDKRKSYIITCKGKSILELEINRLKELYKNGKEYFINNNE